MKKGEKMSKELKKKISKAHMGKILSDEHREKISISKKGRVSWMKGKKGYFKHSEETKKRFSENWKGNKNPRWKGGVSKHTSGYVCISRPDHPHVNSRGYVFEHRLVMEDHLGRYLTPKEQVHHINEKTGDNRIENLMLFPNNAAHMSFHAQIRKNKKNNIC